MSQPPERANSSTGRLRPAVVWPVAAGAAAIWQLLLRVMLGSQGLRHLDYRGYLSLLGLEALIQVLLVSLGAVSLGLWLSLAGSKRAPVITRHFVFGALVATLLALPALLLAGSQLASGDWISAQWFAPAVTCSLVPPSLIAFALVFGALFRTGGDARGRRIAEVAGFLLISAVGAAVDARWMRNLYPEFHMYVAGVSALFSLIAFQRWFAKPLAQRGRTTRIAAASIASLLLLVGGAAWFGMGDDTRSELLVRDQQLSSWLEHARPKRDLNLVESVLEELDVESGIQAQPEAPAWPLGEVRDPDWNVVLIIIDTLRADALPPVRSQSGERFAELGDTPFLDQWLESTYRFSRAYTPASVTPKALPSLFHSAYPFEEPQEVGISLPGRMDSSGRFPFTATTTWFSVHRAAQRMRILEDFREVQAFRLPESQQIVDASRDFFQRHTDRKFFAWIHFMSVHYPGFDGKSVQRRHPREEQYRAGLRWTDAAVGQVIEGLKAAGLHERTVVVLTSDHGESLGPDGYGAHGRSVKEEEIHVPLAIYVPGYPGAIIDEVVGLVDVVPTIADLVDAPTYPSDRGRSLVPLMADPRRRWRHAYYFENSPRSQAGVVLDSDKLVLYTDLSVVSQFDLKNDPNEERDVFSLHDPRSLSLLTALLAYLPEVEEELKVPAVRKLLLERLEQLDQDSNAETVGFLCNLVSVAIRRKVLEETDLGLRNRMLDEVERVFETTKSDAVRVAIVGHLFRQARPRWTRLLVAHLKTLRGTEEQLQFIKALGDEGLPSFDAKYLANAMMSWVTEGPQEQWDAWLNLLGRWERVPPHFSAPLEVMLQRANSESVPDARLAGVARAAANLTVERLSKDKLRRLQIAIRPFLMHSFPPVVVLATTASGRFGDISQADLFAERAKQADDLRVRKESLIAYTELRKRDAAPLLMEVGEDPDMLSLTIRLLGDIRNPISIPFLKRAQGHSVPETRKEAKKALAKVSKAR